jgi:hypothetical protein
MSTPENTENIEKFSPSSLRNIEICPGWRAKEFEENEWSKEGQLLHKCLEEPDNKELRRQLTSEQLEQLKAVEAYTAPLLAADILYHWMEYKLMIGDLFEMVNLRNGIADLIIQRRDNEFEVVDYKFGRKKVEQEDNLQLAVYAAAVFLEFPPARTVKVTILQPRLGLESTTTQTYQFGADFTPIMDRIKAIIKEALDPTSILNPTNENCRFCAKYFSCSAVEKLVSKSSPQVLGVLPISREDISNCLSDPISAERVLSFATFCEQWAKEYKKKITEKVTNHEMELAGYKVVNVKGRKQIRDMDAFKALVDRFLEDHEYRLIADLDPKRVQDYLEASHSEMDKVLYADTLEKSGLLEQGPGYSYLKAVK